VLETRRDPDVPRDRGRLPPEVPDRDYAADEPTLSTSQAGVSEYLRAAYKHRWLAVATLVLVTLPIVAWTWAQKPVYEATVRLVLDPEPQNPLPFREPGQEQPRRKWADPAASAAKQAVGGAHRQRDEAVGAS